MLDTALEYFLKIEDGKLKVYQSNTLFKPLDYVELVEVDSVNACGITTECTIKRSKDPLPKIRTINSKPAIKRVTSLDGAVDLIETTQRAFNRKSALSTFKYDKNFYFWYLDGYIYVPNVDWEAVSVLAYFTDASEINKLNACNNDKTNYECVSMLDEEFPSPSHLLELIIDKVNAKLANLYSRIPEDTNINKNTRT
jgi:hypothetical protein